MSSSDDQNSIQEVQPQPYAHAQAASQQDGKAIASLILGVVSLAGIVLGHFSFLGIGLAVVGLIFGILSKKESPSSMATAGIITSIISLALCSITFIACFACVGLTMFASFI